MNNKSYFIDYKNWKGGFQNQNLYYYQNSRLKIIESIGLKIRGYLELIQSYKYKKKKKLSFLKKFQYWYQIYLYSSQIIYNIYI